MTAPDYRHVGFIRTNSFLKAIDMFDPQRITKLRAERRVKRDTIDRKEYTNKLMIWEKEVCERFLINYERQDHAYAFPEFPVTEVRQMISKYKLGDMVLSELEYEFTDPTLVGWVNQEIERRAEENGKKKEDITFLSDVTKLYVSFKDTTTPDLKALEYVIDLNKDLTTHYGFKLGVLDVTQLITERQKKYGEKGCIPVNDSSQVPKRILKCVNPNGWSIPPIIAENMPTEIRPVSIRTYRSTKKSRWILFKEIEVT